MAEATGEGFLEGGVATVEETATVEEVGLGAGERALEAEEKAEGTGEEATGEVEEEEASEAAGKGEAAMAEVATAWGETGEGVTEEGETEGAEAEKEGVCSEVVDWALEVLEVEETVEVWAEEVWEGEAETAAVAMEEASTAAGC